MGDGEVGRKCPRGLNPEWSPVTGLHGDQWPVNPPEYHARAIVVDLIAGPAEFWVVLQDKVLAVHNGDMAKQGFNAVGLKGDAVVGICQVGRCGEEHCDVILSLTWADEEWDVLGDSISGEPGCVDPARQVGGQVDGETYRPVRVGDGIVVEMDGIKLIGELAKVIGKSEKAGSGDSTNRAIDAAAVQCVGGLVDDVGQQEPV